MLVTLSEILQDAEQNQYAVGLFNMLNLEMARGIIDAAEAERSPVILGVAEVHLPSIPFALAAHNMRKLAVEASVPVCLHFDHGTDYAKLLEAIRGGFSSVMFDGSALPDTENIAGTAEIARVAHALGVSVEAELGHVGMADSDEADTDDGYTRVEQVADFLARSGADALAVAIGTAHGQYKSKPALDLNRLREIYAVSPKPLVLHGGSGLSDDDFRHVVAGGIRKINICTEMCLAAQRAYADAYLEHRSFEQSLIDAKQAVERIVAARMRLFGSAGRA